MTDTDTGMRICAAARRLLGVPFRLHGRNPAMGVDCVGLVLLALKGAGLTVPEPAPYQLRSIADARFSDGARKAGLVVAVGRVPGDIALIGVGPFQRHIVIDAGDAIIHAHAGLGHVVAMPWPSEWRELGRWRVPYGEGDS